MADYQNNHFVSRVLTRAWELDKPARGLAYVNIVKRTLATEPSSKLFARDFLNSPATEQLLSAHIERHLGIYRKRFAEDASFDDPKVYRALMNLFGLQTLRSGEALDPKAKKPGLDEFLARGEVVLDELHYLLHESYHLQVVNAPRETMCFPCTGFFLVPFAGRPPVPAVPFAPDVLFLYVPKKDADGIDVMQWVKMHGMLSAFSCGIGGGLVDRVLVPPQMYTSFDRDKIVRHVRHMSKTTHDLFQLFGRMARTVGLNAYGPTLPWLAAFGVDDSGDDLSGQDDDESESPLPDRLAT